MSAPVCLEHMDPAAESEVIDLANRMWNVMCEHEVSSSSVPASALGCVLAFLMSQTACPEATFMTALTARDRQYKELSSCGDADEITEH